MNKILVTSGLFNIVHYTAYCGNTENPALYCRVGVTALLFSVDQC